MKIIRDTREKNGWDFVPNDVEIVSRALACGDYTTDLLKDKLIIERKATTHEIAQNLGKKTNKARFYREMEKLKKFPHAYIVCEFTESNVLEYPLNCGIPARKFSECRVSGKYLRKMLGDLEREFGVKVVFCNNRIEAERFTYDTITYLEKKYGAPNIHKRFDF